MIRRAFWLGAGAAAGIMGYRRVSALGRRLSGRVPGTVTQPSAAHRAARGAIGMARETRRFTRDVRDGMEIYIARQNGPEPSILTRTPKNPDDKDGR